MRSEINLQGLWWLPKSPDNKIAGTLEYNSSSSPKLKLIGSLSEHTGLITSHKYEIINGVTTDGKKITLLDCQETQLKVSFPGVKTSEYQASMLFIGALFTCKDDIMFHRIEVKMKGMDEWLGISGFSVQNDLVSKSCKIEYKLPGPIYFDFNSAFSSSFSFTANFPIGMAPSTEISMSQAVFLTIEVIDDSPIKYDEYLKIIFHFMSFLTIATQRSSFPISITFFTKEDYHEPKANIKYTSIDLFYTSYIKEYTGTINSHNMLFTFSDIADEFSTICKSWYSNYDRIKTLIDLFIKTLNNSFVFDENTFLNIAHALESFHRKHHNNYTLEKCEHNKRVDDIINAVSSEHKEWLKSKLSFSNEPSLHERLAELLSIYSNETLNRIINSKNDFIKSVKDCRNYYTHYSNSLESKALKDIELYYLTEKMKLLLTFCLLRVSGFSAGIIEKLVMKIDSRHYNSFTP